MFLEGVETDGTAAFCMHTDPAISTGIVVVIYITSSRARCIYSGYILYAARMFIESLEQRRKSAAKTLPGPLFLFCLYPVAARGAIHSTKESVTFSSLLYEAKSRKETDRI